LARPRLWAVASTLAALFAVLLIALWPKPDPKSNVRVCNASPWVLHNVTVGRTSYGDILPGGSTGYRFWGPAYTHPKVELEAHGIRLRQVPDDNFGETPLGRGTFCYVITVVDPKSEDDFTVEATKD